MIRSTLISSAKAKVVENSEPPAEGRPALAHHAPQSLAVALSRVQAGCVKAGRATAILPPCADLPPLQIVICRLMIIMKNLIQYIAFLFRFAL